MLNLLTKTKPWMVASLLVATTLFGQDPTNSKPSAQGGQKACGKAECKPSKPCPAPCPQPCPPTQMCPQAPNPCCPPWPVPVLNAAYNYPARTMTRCPWDINFDASFIYWQPLQDNMELGLTAQTTAGTVGSMINMDFGYKPGFKVGFGGNLDYDNWDIRGKYTWFHNTQSASYTADTANGYAIYPTQASPNFVGSSSFVNASQKWKLHMDIAELSLGRAAYVGTKLTFSPSFGVRAAWIRQYLDVNYSNATGTTVETVTGKSQSWAVGPQIGLDTNWILGCGFRFYGNAEGDILYTDYTRDSFNEYPLAATTSFHTKQNHIHTVRTHLDLELGFGWGTYWDCNNWYTDFALGYDFQVFFDQNMFRHFTNGPASTGARAQSNVPNGNLYLQGLTAKFKLDF